MDAMRRTFRILADNYKNIADVSYQNKVEIYQNDSVWFSITY